MDERGKQLTGRACWSVKGGLKQMRDTKRSKTNIPEESIEAIARCIYPDILAYYESEEGQQEFEKWKAAKKEMREE